MTCLSKSASARGHPMYQDIINDITSAIEQTRRKLTTYTNLIRQNSNNEELLSELLGYWFRYRRHLDDLTKDRRMMREATRR